MNVFLLLEPCEGARKLHNTTEVICGVYSSKEKAIEAGKALALEREKEECSIYKDEYYILQGIPRPTPREIGVDDTEYGYAHITVGKSAKFLITPYEVDEDGA